MIPPRDPTGKKPNRLILAFILLIAAASAIAFLMMERDTRTVIEREAIRTCGEGNYTVSETGFECGRQGTE